MRKCKCPNKNHNLAFPPIRICPQCGEILNFMIPENSCSAATHVRKSAQNDAYCTDCGEYLLSQMHG